MGFAFHFYCYSGRNSCDVSRLLDLMNWNSSHPIIYGTKDERERAEACLTTEFIMSWRGVISTPPEIVECADEQEAIGKAAQAANGKAVELWEGARLIVRFPQHEG